MRYHALAADYDGTLAHHGEIDEPTIAALQRLRESGRRLIMVTGRELDELLGILTRPELFDRIVAENGAVVYTPETKAVRLIASPPPPEFVDELRRRGVQRVSAGRVIVATWEPHQDTVLATIRDMGLELQVIFNKGAVMVLPSGVNKATGLAAALVELGLSRHNVVAIGDAENDHALLESSECGVAVANALDSLQAKADLVTGHDHGAGVNEVIERLIEDDLASCAPKRHRLVLGKDDRGSEVTLDPYASNILVCGTSGSGKSTLTTGLLERLAAASYQFAIIDPEGDYTSLDFAVALGGTNRAPLVEEIEDVLDDPARNVAINLLGVALDHRPEYFAQLLPPLTDLRMRLGRPHWLVIDEAHHLLPSTWQPADESSPRVSGTLYVTVHPESVAPTVLSTINVMLAIGEHPIETVRAFCEAAKLDMPEADAPHKLPHGQALLWRVGEPRATLVQTEPPTFERTRHSRKYIEGNLGPHSFYFRGPEGKLNLKASNLLMFLQIGDGVDDDTWMFHYKNGDYARWFRHDVKDGDLADAVAHGLTIGSAAEGRAAIRAEIEKRYTLPADKPTGLIDDAPATTAQSTTTRA